MSQERITPHSALKLYDVVMWVGDSNRYYTYGNQYMLVYRDESGGTLASPTMKNGWSPEGRLREGYKLATENKWRCRYSASLHVCKVTNSIDAVFCRSQCVSCRYDCKKLKQEDCPLYEEMG